MSKNHTFKPSLGLIEEESIYRNSVISLQEDDILCDYEVLTEYDLVEALDLDECDRGAYIPIDENVVPDNLTDKSFADIHKDTMNKNKTIIDKFSVAPDIDRHQDLFQGDQDNKPRRPDEEYSKENIMEKEINEDVTASMPCSIQQHIDNNLCVDFNSNIGRKIFLKAIHQKYMNIYYILPQQCMLQESHSGSATLLLLLNALKVEPLYSKHRFDKDLLQFFNDLDKNVSWGFDNFVLMCRLNHLSVEAVWSNELTTIDVFRYIYVLNTFLVIVFAKEVKMQFIMMNNSNCLGAELSCYLLVVARTNESFEVSISISNNGLDSLISSLVTELNVDQCLSINKITVNIYIYTKKLRLFSLEISHI